MNTLCVTQRLLFSFDEGNCTVYLSQKNVTDTDYVNIFAPELFWLCERELYEFSVSILAPTLCYILYYLSRK